MGLLLANKLSARDAADADATVVIAAATVAVISEYVNNLDLLHSSDLC